MVVDFLLIKLLASELLLLINDWKRRNDDLWVLLDQIVTKLNEIDVKTLNFPAHWVGIQNHHQRLTPNVLADLGCDQLINTIKKDIK